ncbi:MAG: M56 family metallopeptidase, partial [Agathobacter sp.]|nr:M56 family metallopeptidase [Agathobacter sp.]
MEAVCMKIVEMSIAASWLILAVIVLRLFLSKAPKGFRYVLWALVAIRLICPFSPESTFCLVPDVESFFTEETPEADINQDNPIPEQNNAQNNIQNNVQNSVQNGIQSGVQNNVQNDVQNGAQNNAQGTVTDGTVTSRPNGNENVQFGQDTTVSDDVLETVPDVDEKIEEKTGAQGLVDMFVAARPWTWLTDGILLVIYMIISYLYLWNKVKVSVPIGDNVFICDEIRSPFIFGIIRPRIYVPSHIEKEQMTYIIAHEKEHLRCFDYLWKPFGFVILAIHWFNPLVWVAYVLMCRDLELACDERVIRNMNAFDKKSYSETLLACSSPRHYISACPVAFGEISIKERIKKVLLYKKPATWVIGIAVLVCLIIG